MSKMIYCRTCGAPIAKSAKICPHCGARNKKHGFLKVLLALVLLSAAGGFYSGFGHSSLPGHRPPARTLQSDGSAEERKSGSSAADTPAAGAENPASRETAPAAAAISSSGKVTPELKEFLDAYEEVMNEYCDFMESFDSDDPAALLRYTSLLGKYMEFSEKAEAYNEEDMSKEDLEYYIDVTSRINKRLLSITD